MADDVPSSYAFAIALSLWLGARHIPLSFGRAYPLISNARFEFHAKPVSPGHGPRGSDHNSALVGFDFC